MAGEGRLDDGIHKIIGLAGPGGGAERSQDNGYLHGMASLEFKPSHRLPEPARSWTLFPRRSPVSF